MCPVRRTKEIEMDNADKASFCEVSNDLQLYLGFSNVKAAFPDIPHEPHERIAYTASFHDSEKTILKDALAKHPGTETIIDSFFSNALVRQISSEPDIGRRCRLVLRACNSLRAQRLIAELRKAGVANVDDWSKDLKKRYDHYVEFGELYLEGQYALALQKNGMRVRMKPYGNEGGPDLQVSTRDLLFDIEISHFRKDEGLEGRMSDRIAEMPDKTQNLWSKIEDKTRQLREDKHGIILLRSDNIGIDDMEFWRIAEKVACNGLEEKLCAIVFSDGYTRHKAIPNPHAGLPAQELRPALQTIESCLNSAG